MFIDHHRRLSIRQSASWLISGSKADRRSRTNYISRPAHERNTIEDVAWSQVGQTRRIDVLPEGGCASVCSGRIVTGPFNGLSGCACHASGRMDYLLFVHLRARFPSRGRLERQLVCSPMARSAVELVPVIGIEKLTSISFLDSPLGLGVPSS